MESCNLLKYRVVGLKHKKVCRLLTYFLMPLISPTGFNNVQVAIILLSKIMGL